MDAKDGVGGEAEKGKEAGSAEKTESGTPKDDGRHWERPGFGGKETPKTTSAESGTDALLPRWCKQAHFDRPPLGARHRALTCSASSLLGSDASSAISRASQRKQTPGTSSASDWTTGRTACSTCSGSPTVVSFATRTGTRSGTTTESSYTTTGFSAIDGSLSSSGARTAPTASSSCACVCPTAPELLYPASQETAPKPQEALLADVERLTELMQGLRESRRRGSSAEFLAGLGRRLEEQKAALERARDEKMGELRATTARLKALRRAGAAQPPPTHSRSAAGEVVCDGCGAEFCVYLCPDSDGGDDDDERLRPILDALVALEEKVATAGTRPGTRVQITTLRPITTSYGHIEQVYTDVAMTPDLGDRPPPPNKPGA